MQRRKVYATAVHMVYMRCVHHEALAAQHQDDVCGAELLKKTISLIVRMCARAFNWILHCYSSDTHIIQWWKKGLLAVA